MIPHCFPLEGSFGENFTVTVLWSWVLKKYFYLKNLKRLPDRIREILEFFSLKQSTCYSLALPSDVTDTSTWQIHLYFEHYKYNLGCQTHQLDPSQSFLTHLFSGDLTQSSRCTQFSGLTFQMYCSETQFGCFMFVLEETKLLVTEPLFSLYKGNMIKNQLVYGLVLPVPYLEYLS